jgi:uncharacterized membrane protein
LPDHPAAIRPLQQLRFEPATIRKIAAVTGSVVISYIAFVYLIFFLTYTPTTIDHVRGVQGRYFVIVLPPAAIFLAAILNRSLSQEIRSAAAIAGALLSGIACCEALLRAHWLV